MTGFKSITLLLFFLFCSASLFSQYSIHGKIVGFGERPLSGVTIFITDLQKGTISDSNGQYEIKDLRPTITNVQFTLIGYKSMNKLVDPSVSKNLNVCMEQGITNLNEVLVTGNNIYSSEKFPFPIHTIYAENMRANSAPTMMGNLSYLPGIDKISLGNGIEKPVMRGLSFNQIALYSQGTKIENQQWDDHHDLGLSDIGIEKVEIIQGPSALIYGADAVGGALIFIDEKPAPNGTKLGDANFGFYSNSLGINADAGVKATKKNGFFYGLRIGGASHTSYVQGKNEMQSNTKEDEFAANSKFNNINIKFNTGIIKKWGISKLSYNIYDQEIGIIEDESSAANSPTNAEAEQRTRELDAPYQSVISQVLSSENTVFLLKSKFNINLSYQRNDRKEFEPLPDKQKELYIGLKLDGINFNVKWSSNTTKLFGLSLGAQGSFFKNKNYGKNSLVPDADLSDVAGFGLIRYDFKKINLLGGFRIDTRNINAKSYEGNIHSELDSFITLHSHDTLGKPNQAFNIDYSPLSFSCGATYFITEKFNLKTNFATGFTAPNYAQLGTFGKHEGTYRFERGDVNLKVEHNFEYDVGFIWKSKFLTLTLSGYINKLKNFIYLLNTGDSIIQITSLPKSPNPLYQYKQGDATYSGGEFSLRLHSEKVDWFTMNIGYSLLDASLKTGGKIAYLPSNKLITEVRIGKKKAWIFVAPFFDLKVSNYEKRKQIADYEIASSGYTVTDISLGGNIKLFKQQTTLTLFCTNLMNTGYFNQLSLLKNIGVRDMGRNIGFKLSIPFNL